LTAGALLPSCTQRTIHEGAEPFQASTYQIEMAVGMNRLTSGNWDEAHKHFLKAEEAAETGAERAQAKAGLGGVELFRGDYDKADQILREAIEEEPRTADAWIFLSRSQLMQGDTLAAIGTLQEGRLEAPQRADVEAVLGLVYLEWGAPAQAALHLERALESEPNRQEWLEALRQAQLEAGITPLPVADPVVSDSLLAEPEDSVEAETFRPSEGETLIEAQPSPGVVAGGAAAAVVPLTMEPSSERLRQLRRHADALAKAERITRMDLAVLLTMNGPEITPWPGLGDLPADVREQEYAEAAAVALFAGWMKRMPDGLFYPDDPLNRSQTALLIYPQVKRYPALGKRARLSQPQIPDVPTSHYAYLEIATVVAAGLMELDNGANFRPDEPLSGAAGDHVARQLTRAVEEGLSGLRDDPTLPPPDPSSP
jgi:tetratricopeptide (TPR) repeat protein